MYKRTFRVTILFSLLVFVILTITMALMGVISMLLLNLGLVQNLRREMIFVIFAFISVIMGTILSHVVGRRPLKAIVAINEATKEVVKGNLDIQLNEAISATEFRSMTHNFNVMVKELAGMEIFRKDFIENVSHEFKTPLSAIEGYVMLLQKKDLSQEKRREYTDRILINTRRLSSLTGNILLLARLEHQELEVTRERYSLDEQLREVILLFESQWTRKNLDLDIELCSLDYSGNKELMMQVWQNIFGNAVKFVPEYGKIEVILKEEHSAIKVSIVDNGMGMDEETKKRVYEKFYQADSSRAGLGNGLGLTLAKRIVDLHGGSITVSSKVGKGTAFTVWLPPV